MSYRDMINAIKPFAYAQYSHVSSNEKLGACTAYYLQEHEIPITFNYLCVAMFKMFPETFYCDEDFKEYPSIDRLNRTLMHMAITKNKTDAILAGSAKLGYQLTKYGSTLGKATYESILNPSALSEQPVKRKPVDSHKAGPSAEYLLLKNSPFFDEWLKTGKIRQFAIWKLFRVTPFTQENTIRDRIKEAKAKAKELEDVETLGFIDELLKQLD